MGLGRVGDVCVAGFNRFADGLETIKDVVSDFGPVETAAEVGQYCLGLASKCALGDQKTLFFTPVAFLNPLMNFFNIGSSWEGLKNFSLHASAAKSFASAVDVFSKAPKLWKDFSTKINDNERVPARKYIVVSKGEGGETISLTKSRPLTSNEQLCRKLGTLALWTMSFGDVVREIGNCREISPLWGRVLPWVRTVSGVYLGVQGLYEGGVVFSEQLGKVKGVPIPTQDDSQTQVSHEKNSVLTESTEPKVHPLEYLYSVVGLATSVSYLAYSVFGGIGLYLKEETPEWVKTLQFLGLGLVTVVPAAQALVKGTIEQLHAEQKPVKND